LSRPWQAAETARSRSRPTIDLTAYDLYLRALSHSLSYERDQLVRALELLGQAMERDAHYGPALALAAHCHQRFAVMNWTEDLEAVRVTSVNSARQALRIGPDEPDVLALAAFTLGYFGEDIDVAIGLIDRCLSLNPSYARVGTGALCFGFLPVSPISHLSTLGPICASAHVNVWRLICLP
jgi:adenylate cyclase